jgi:hypothetical protein
MLVMVVLIHAIAVTVVKVAVQPHVVIDSFEPPVCVVMIVAVDES